MHYYDAFAQSHSSKNIFNCSELIFIKDNIFCAVGKTIDIVNIILICPDFKCIGFINMDEYAVIDIRFRLFTAYVRYYNKTVIAVIFKVFNRVCVYVSSSVSAIGTASPFIA